MLKVFTHHPRTWRQFDYVYPVVSRRARGLSIGVNVNVDKVCNFDCIYCQVDRTAPAPRTDVDLDQLRAELQALLNLAASGGLWDDPAFAATPAPLRRLNDIAFSGDGEPSVFPRIDRAVRIAADVKSAAGLAPVKIVLVTNATGLHRAATLRALAIMDAHGGEVWAKLDAGTEPYYHLVDRTRFPFHRVLRNILECGKARPLVIQSLFMQVRGKPPDDAEFDAYLERLRELRQAGCRIKLVQLYTVARRPAESYVTPLAAPQLDAMALRLRARLPDLAVETHPGSL